MKQLLGIKKLFLLAVLLLVANLAGAQNYVKINYSIDSLLELGLPKSALQKVDQLEVLARRDGNVAQQVRASVYRMMFQSYIEENALVAIIIRLKLDIAKSQYPVKPVLQSVLATMYSTYYQQNRWNFYNRTRLDKLGDDFTKWDLQTIIDKTTITYRESLTEAKREQETPIDILDGILVGDKQTRYLRPTLYDLLVQQALDFFLSDEPSITKPKLAFSVNDPRFFGDSRAFANLTIKTTDTASTYYNGLKYLQQATQFHLQKPEHAEALADLDIKRLEFVYNKATFANKDSIYTAALKQIARRFATKPISADALTAIGKYYQLKDSLRYAIAVLNKATEAFPQSLGAENARIVISQIERKELSATVENGNMPNKPILVSLAYQNVQQANVKIYKVTEAQRSKLLEARNQYYARDVNKGVINDILKSKTPVQQQALQLPNPHDYRNHTTEFKLDAMPAGNYIIWLSDAQSTDSTLISFTDIKVTRLAFLSRGRPDGEVEVRVMDRETGEPIKNVKVIAGTRSRGYKEDFTTSGTTDKNGYYQPAGITNGNIALKLMYQGDTLINDQKYVYGATAQSDEDDDKTVLFTDRQIYRPGQTVYFKGIQLHVVKGGSTIVPQKNVNVEFKDGNDKQLSKLDLVSNDFGSFSGLFTIPQSMLNGQATISTADGNVSFRVEEYKRPSFQAELLPVTESYKLNDSVKLKGVVKAFSGYGLSQARVAYHITRTTNYTYGYWRGNIGSPYNFKQTEIKTDTINSDDQGRFTIKFKAIPDEVKDVNGLVFRYAVNVDITDASGETHSANTGVNVGNNNISINTYLPAQTFANDTNKVFIGINNLNGRALKGSVQVQVYALQNPGRLFKNRLWPVPDQYLLKADAYKNNFADYAYRKEDEPQRWAQLNKVSNLNVSVNDSTNSFFSIADLRKQPSGIYKVVINASNDKGDTTSVIRYITLIADPAKPVSFSNWVTPTFSSVKSGEPAEFLVGIDRPVRILMEKYNGVNLISSQWITTGSAQQKIKVPMSVQDSNTAVQFMMVYRNRVYSSYQKVYVKHPDQTLGIKFITFRNILQPGQKEEWKLQIKAPDNQKEAAEMVASLYDASLDDLNAGQNWNTQLNVGQRYEPNYYAWVIYDFVDQDATSPLYYRYKSYALTSRRYEMLDMMGYGYYGGYNRGYYNYISSARQRMQQYDDKSLNDRYTANAKLVKDGVEVTGHVMDFEDKFRLPGVAVSIKGTAIGTITNSAGYFKIRVPKNGVLVFNFIGYERQEVDITKAADLNVVLKGNSNRLNEVVVVGYGSKMKTEMTGAVSNIMIRGNSSLNADMALEGRVPGVNVAGGAMQKLNNEEDDKVILRELYAKPGQKFSKERIVHNAQLINDFGDQANITIRKNFSETAFFYPQLVTNAKGEIMIDFTIPESLTKWKFRAFAHTQSLKTGYLESSVVTQKQLSISANTPRFLREGDTITISARLANLTGSALQGKVSLQLFNGVTMQPVILLLNAKDAAQSFDIAAASTKAISFKLYIPGNLDALTYRLTADAGQFTDGEENTIPVLPNRMLVTETMPMMLRGGQTKAFNFDKLVNQRSTTLHNKTLTLEYTQNPAWYAVQALPYMMEFPYECSEQIFSRYYANSMGASLVSKMPVIKRVFDQWKAVNSPELLSNLEKNQELKATLIEETPWLRDAVSESEQKKRIALLFDMDKMSYQLKLNLDKLKEKQMLDGSFPWFGGDRGDAYITRHILAGIGQLYHLNIATPADQELDGIAVKAMSYMNNNLIETAARQKNYKVYEGRKLYADEIHAYYTQSYFPGAVLSYELKSLRDNYLKLAEDQWRINDFYDQAMIAITMLRNNRQAVAQQIIHSLTETAQTSDEMGMYWAKNQWGYYWYQSPIETQSLMIELFTEAGNNDKAVEEMKVWLLRNKQTNNWKTTKATAAACYALLLKGSDWLADNRTSDIKLNNKNLSELKPDIKAEAGTGYFKTSWVEEQIKPEMGKVSITNNGKTISWGAMYWQYLENLDKITPSNTDIHLERKYFIQKQTDAGVVLTAIDAQHQPKVGDLIKVVVYLKSGRDYEYVQLKDTRPAGTEPVDVLSAYKFQDGLYYYQVTKDVATNFFISHLNKGNYVFEYRLRVAQPGNFSTGISSVQCMYAPEFTAHSEGMRMSVRP